MDNAQNWLKVCGSKEGQEAFNPKKGSICARTDCDPKLFNAYLQSAMVDWSKDAIVPSVVHGAAAIESGLRIYKDTMQSVRHQRRRGGHADRPAEGCALTPAFASNLT